jgi:hypothetical protein
LITKNQYVALEICRLANREANSKAKTLTWHLRYHAWR